MLESEIVSVQSELNSFAPNSKIWVYYSDRNFDSVSSDISNQVNQFVSKWSSHGSQVDARGYVILNQIIILVANALGNDVSGCSTDSSVHFIKSLESNYQLSFFDRSRIFYWKNNQIQSIQFTVISTLSSDTKVFNPFFKDLEEWQTSFIMPLSKSKFRNLL